MTVYSAESFLRATIRQSTAGNQSVPYTLKVSKIPTLTNGLLTISPNTSNEEIVEYDGVDGAALTITVVKNGINPSAQLLTTNGVDYNNPLYIKAHSQNDVIRGDVNHIHINQGIGNSTLATNIGVGISKLSLAAVDAGDPIVVGDNDPRLTRKVFAYQYSITSGAALDGTFRNLVGFGTNGDRDAAVSSSLVTGLGTMTGTITNRSYNATITILPGEICSVGFNYATSSTLVVRTITTGGAIKFVEGENSTDLTNARRRISFINVGGTNMVLTFQLADSGLSRPFFGLNIEVY